ncbi:MAG TPA: hypothetical protein VK907_03775, partial [Phnomibacter sp.]|nr:hypothetical protein [Phnomibacter sp.]
MRDFLEIMDSLFIERRKMLNSLHENNFRAELFMTSCKGCTEGAPVHWFRYYHQNGWLEDRANLGYRIEWEEGILMDIYRCLYYKGCTCIGTMDDDDIFGIPDTTDMREHWHLKSNYTKIVPE